MNKELKSYSISVKIMSPRSRGKKGLMRSMPLYLTIIHLCSPTKFWSRSRALEIQKSSCTTFNRSKCADFWLSLSVRLQCFNIVTPPNCVNMSSSSIRWGTMVVFTPPSRPSKTPHHWCTLSVLLDCTYKQPFCYHSVIQIIAIPITQKTIALWSTHMVPQQRV